MFACILEVPSLQIRLGWCDEHRHKDEADEAEDDKRQKIPHQLTPKKERPLRETGRKPIGDNVKRPANRLNGQFSWPIR